MRQWPALRFSCYEMNTTKKRHKHSPPNKTRGRIHLKRSVQTTDEDISCSLGYTRALLELQKKKMTFPLFALCMRSFDFTPESGDMNVRLPIKGACNKELG